MALLVKKARVLELQAQVEKLSLKNLELAKTAQQALTQLKNQKEAALSEPSDYLTHLKAENQRLQFQLEQLQLESPLKQSEFLLELRFANLALSENLELLRLEYQVAQAEIELAQSQIPALQSKYLRALRKSQALEEKLEELGEDPDNNQGCCHSNCC
jgi:chromosome segregation ATPase